MPNKLPKPNNSTFRWGYLLLGLLPLALFGLQQVPAQENPTAESQTGPLNAEKPDAPDPAAAKMAEQALQTLQEARRRIESYDSLKADLLETVLIGTRRFQSKGSYLHARGNNVKLELEVTLKGADGKPLKGTLLEMSNGSVMHSSRHIGKQQEITRRDLNSIFAAIEKYPSTDAELLRARLGVGGLPALLASLERSFLFSEYKQETINDSQYIMIGGGWKPSVLKRHRPKDNPNATLAPYVPDYVRVYFDKQSLFPRRVFYFKTTDNKRHPMLTLDFLNVQQNVPLAPYEFDYSSLEDDVVPTDITQQLIEQIIRSYQARPQTEPQQQNPPETGTPPAKAPATPENSGK